MWFDETFFKALFLQKDKSFWYSLRLDRFNRAEEVGYFTKILLECYGFPDKETLSLLQISYDPSNISLVIVLITAYLKEIENRKEKSIYNVAQFFKINTGCSLYEKKSAALALKTYLENIDPLNKENNLQSLADSFPALTCGRLGEMFKFVCPSLERNTLAKVGTARGHTL